MIMGFAKSAIDSMKVTKKAFPKPGRMRGMVTEVKTFHREAPISRAASSREGSIFMSRPLSIM